MLDAVNYNLMIVYGVGMVNPELAVSLTGRKGEALEKYKQLLLDLNNKVVAKCTCRFNN